MELKSRGSAQEQLLFQLLGIPAQQPEQQKTDSALLLGLEAPEPDEAPYLRLPDPDQPDGESERLARLLGKAIGIGRVHL